MNSTWLIDQEVQGPNATHTHTHTHDLAFFDKKYCTLMWHQCWAEKEWKPRAHQANYYSKREGKKQSLDDSRTEGIYI